MLIDWPRFLAALALLLAPVVLFHHRRVRLRHLDREWTGYFSRALNLGTHYIDAGRAALGALLLLESLTVSPGAAGNAQWVLLGTQAAVLTLGSMIQTLVCREAGAAHAPFAYVSGLALGFFPIIPACIALIFSVAVVMGVRHAVSFFPVLAVALAATCHLLSGGLTIVRIAVGSFVVVLPWLLTLLFPRPMMASHMARRVHDKPDPRR